jgi:hypothetical protein
MALKALSALGLMLFPFCLQASGYGTQAGLLFADQSSPRAVALGGVDASLRNGTFSLTGNPAGMALMRGFEVTAGHAFNQMDAQRESLALGWGQAGFGAVGLNAAYLHLEDTARDAQGRSTGSINNSNLLAGLGYAAEPLPGLALGFGVKGLRETYADIDSYAAAADLGLLALLPWGIDLGVTARNLGWAQSADGVDQSELSKRFAAGIGLPLGLRWLRADAECRWLTYEDQTLLLGGLEAALPFTLPGQGNQGSLALRAGGRTGLNYTEPARFSAGFGLEVAAFRVDYAWTRQGELGWDQAISLAARFGSPATVPLPEPVQDIRLVLEPGKARLEWTHPDRTLRGFNLYTGSGTLAGTFRPAKMEGSYFAGIKTQAGTAYSFNLRAVDRLGRESAASRTISFAGQ